jgi:dTDP-4-dehydrorhamnose reductase
MNILILGASGMLGHQLWLHLGEYHQVTGTLRTPNLKLSAFQNKRRKLIEGVHSTDEDGMKDLLMSGNFDVVINCIGVIKQLDEVKNAVGTIFSNSLFPHIVAKWAKNAKVIQVSTDCVFSGKKGNYSETDFPDASDLYGRSKLLGEIDYSPHLTLRTSIVGHELQNSVSLIDWFLSQKGTIKGYTKAIYSGLTNLELAKQVNFILEHHQELSGIWQIASDPIDKYSLLKKTASVYQKQIEIDSYDEYSSDKSLNYSKLQRAIGYVPRSWDQMLVDLHDHYIQYLDQLYTKTK